MSAQDHERFERLAGGIVPGGSLVRTWDLHGGVSARVTVLEIRRPDGRIERMVSRRHGEADLARNPDIAADEYRLLKALHGVGMPVPEPYYVDPHGEFFSTPCIVVEYIEGAVDLDPDSTSHAVRRMAENLARIHKLDVSIMGLDFLPSLEDLCAALLARRPAALDESMSEGQIREALEAVWPLPALNSPALLHRDFWPGNLLWRDGTLAGIVDWEDAALGDPVADLANSRLEILWAYGAEAMRDFTEYYTEMMPALDYSQLAYWDLFAALRPASRLSSWGLDELTERQMRERHHQFVDDALARVLPR